MDSVVYFLLFLLQLSLLIGIAEPRSQDQGRIHEAGFDRDGNIYVMSDTGNRIVMGKTNRCTQTSQAPDRQTILCLVKDALRTENPIGSRAVEIYVRGGKKSVIRADDLIREWHFVNDGEEVEVCWGQGRNGTHGLFDAASGRLLASVAEPEEESSLPQWAKSLIELEDESVPVGRRFDQERTKWISKTLRRIQKVQPGMHRKDLMKVFTTEGGISNRLQRTYVYSECPYIKVDVRFKPINDRSNLGKEDPEDMIASISQPYLHWSTMD
jgi:hypothetical protein